ncbi:hypothetical protein [Porphyromonas loveana]|uniref:hypothetical protein n=1 Tax=Porphyromonas loveana TaxID=1884669 RepID=UPI0035A175B1
MLQIGKKVFWLAAMTLVFASCGPKENKLGHDIPTELIVRFTEGTLVEPEAGSINVRPSAFKPNPAMKPFIAHLTSAHGGDSFTYLPGDSAVRLKKGVWYRIENFLFDSKYNPISDQIMKPDQIERHQFFFNLMSRGGVVSKGLSYYYADTTATQFIESPVGLNGYIRIDQEKEEPEIRIMLIHVENGTKYEADGKPNPFDKPSPRVLEFGDLSTVVPFEYRK